MKEHIKGGHRHEGSRREKLLQKRKEIRQKAKHEITHLPRTPVTTAAGGSGNNFCLSSSSLFTKHFNNIFCFIVKIKTYAKRLLLHFQVKKPEDLIS